MKRSEIAMIVLVAGFSIIITYFIANAVIGQPSKQSQSITTYAPIARTVKEPDSSIFNSNAINPTVEVEIGGNSSDTNNSSTTK